MEFLPLVGIALLFWLFIIRPASRRQKELGRMQSSLSVGDEVVLTSGIYGTVHQIEDDHLGIEIATGVVVKAARAAIGSRIERPDDHADDRTEDHTEDHAEPGPDQES